MYMIIVFTSSDTLKPYLLYAIMTCILFVHSLSFCNKEMSQVFKCFQCDVQKPAIVRWDRSVHGMKCMPRVVHNFNRWWWSTFLSFMTCITANISFCAFHEDMPDIYCYTSSISNNKNSFLCFTNLGLLASTVCVCVSELCLLRENYSLVCKWCEG